MFRKFLTISLFLFFVFLCTSCSGVNSDNNHKEIKTYKVCSDKYINYIYKAGKKAFENSEVFVEVHSTTHYPYLVIRYFTDKKISDEKFNEEVERIYSNFSEEIYQFKYTKKKCGIKYTYEYINLEFYNKERNQSVYKTYKQFNVA